MFQYCPQKCKFCFQDNDDKTGLDSFSHLQAHIITWFRKQSDDIQYQMNILGGELFQKKFIDKFYDYSLFIDHMEYFCQNKVISYNFVSNLMFDKKVQWHVEHLLDYSGATLSTSFDYDSVNQKYHNNLIHFEDKIKTITFVLTRPFIKDLLKERDLDYFIWLTDQFDVQWDYYTPNKFSDELMPSDKEIYDALCFLIDNFPELPQVKSLMYNGVVKTSCLSPNKVTFLPNGEVVACRYQDYNQTEFETPIDRGCNSNIIENFLSTRGCLECEYYKRCPLSCFVMTDHISYREREELDECLYKKLFRKYQPDI